MATIWQNFIEFLSPANCIFNCHDWCNENFNSFQSWINGEENLQLTWLLILTICFQQIHDYSGDLVINTLLSCFLYFTLEEPILIIEKFIYSRFSSSNNKI